MSCLLLVLFNSFSLPSNGPLSWLSRFWPFSNTFLLQPWWWLVSLLDPLPWQDHFQPFPLNMGTFLRCLLCLPCHQLFGGRCSQAWGHGEWCVSGADTQCQKPRHGAKFAPGILAVRNSWQAGSTPEICIIWHSYLHHTLGLIYEKLKS